MERRHLMHFLAVVEEGSVSAAARRLQYAQPSVSQAIRELERELGVALFHRRRGMTITPTGRALIGPARRALRSFATARAAIDDVKDLVTGELEIGILANLAVHPFVEITAEFTHRHPGVRIRARDAAASVAAFDALDRGEFELLMHDHPPLVHGYDEAYLGSRQAVAIFSPDFRDLPPGPVSLDDIASYPIVGAPAPGLAVQVHLNQLQAERGRPPLRAIVETPHNQTLIPLVISNVGVALVPEAEGAAAATMGAVVRPLDFELRRDYALYSRREELSPAARAFIGVASKGTAARSDA